MLHNSRTQPKQTEKKITTRNQSDSNTSKLTPAMILVAAHLCRPDISLLLALSYSYKLVKVLSVYVSGC